MPQGAQNQLTKRVGVQKVCTTHDGDEGEMHFEHNWKIPESLGIVLGNKLRMSFPSTSIS